MAVATNPLSYNAYIQNMGVLAVYQTLLTAGVYAFVDAPISLSVPQMLNYAELRIQRDLDLLASQAPKTYTLTAGVNVFPLPVDDFVTVQTLEILQTNGATVVDASTLLPVSKEFIQNCYSGLVSAGTPQYFAMYGDTFGGTGDSLTNILLGPAPNFAYTLRVTGTSRIPSLFKYATNGPADTTYTYISAYYPDLLTLASMIYITMLQRNFGPTSDTPESGMTYEKQYQALRIGAIGEENRRKQMGSSWSAYSTPVSATPTR
jgi:hypothetical protein